jgi:hypothetical protein
MLWLVDRTQHLSQVRVVAGAGRVWTLPTPWLGHDRIVAFSLSRDGVRFAAILQDGGGARRLVVSTIYRAEAKRGKSPIELAQPDRIENPSIALSRLRDLAWASPTSLAVLGAENASGPLQPYDVSIDGSEIEAAGGLSPPSGLVSIAAGASTDAPVAVAAQDGNVYVQGGDLNWQPVRASTALYAPAYPG